MEYREYVNLCNRLVKKLRIDEDTYVLARSWECTYRSKAAILMYWVETYTAYDLSWRFFADCFARDAKKIAGMHSLRELLSYVMDVADEQIKEPYQCGCMAPCGDGEAEEEDY